MSDFGEGLTVKANKRHQCIWCYEPIVVGEYHHRYKGMWEGDWQDWRMHLDCIQAHYRESDGDGEICQEPHQRGRTCGETEDKRFEFIRELAQIVEADRKKGKSDYEIAQTILGEVEEWQSVEEVRVKKAREEAMKKPPALPVEVAS
jgi:hypothetical protein